MLIRNLQKMALNKYQMGSKVMGLSYLVLDESCKHVYAIILRIRVKVHDVVACFSRAFKCDFCIWSKSGPTSRKCYKPRTARIY